MARQAYTLLDDRGLLAVDGKDGREFLQGLISNDTDRIAPNCAIYAALLTPQGKYLHDFFVLQFAGALVLDCERKRLDDLKKRLTIYKLRARVELNDLSDDFAVAAVTGDSRISRNRQTVFMASAASTHQETTALRMTDHRRSFHDR